MLPAWAIVVPGSGRIDAERQLPHRAAGAGLRARCGPAGPAPAAAGGGGPDWLVAGRRCHRGPPDAGGPGTGRTTSRSCLSRAPPSRPRTCPARSPICSPRNVRETTIVCGVLHLPRVRYHFGGVYPRHGIRCSYALTAQLPTPGLIAWEAAALRGDAAPAAGGAAPRSAESVSLPCRWHEAGASRRAATIPTCRSASCSIRRWPHRRKWGYRDEQQQHR